MADAPTLSTPGGTSTLGSGLGVSPTRSLAPVAVSVAPGSPAALAGVLVHDEIVRIQLAIVRDRLAGRRIDLHLTDAAAAALAAEGCDPAFGARPLKRIIQRRLVDPLAIQLLEGKLAEGDMVTVDAVEGDLVITPVREV